MARPQKYPKADYRSQWFQDDFGASKMNTNVCLWHSTETPSWPGYSGGAMAPNLTCRPDGHQLQWRQHFDIDRSSRALENRAGGVETNTLNVVQVEMIGTCDRTYYDRWHGRYPDLVFYDDPPDYVLAGLAHFAEWLHEEHGIPLTSPGLEWLEYPSSYGNRNGQRMTYSQWRNFSGHCGHQHVPEQSHGDPGAFPIHKILEGVDMLNADDIFNAVWRGGNEIPAPWDADNSAWWAQSHMTTQTQYALQNARDAAATLALTKQLVERGTDLTAAEIEAAVKAGLESVIDAATVTLQAKGE